MRLFIKLFLCLFLVPVSALCQERISKVMVGPKDDEIRVAIVFIEPTQESYKMQSMIIDVNPSKKKEPATSFHLDLTSTVRSLSTGVKKQKILLLRWKKTGEIELKCDGKWVRQDAGPAVDKIVEATKAVIQNVPLDTKSLTEVTLQQDVELKVGSILNTLDTEDIPCLRNLD